MQDVEQFLQSNGVEYTLHEHPAVFNCEDAEEHCKNIPGLACKNLVLTDKKSGRYFFLILPAAKRTDLKKFSELVGQKNISFASSDVLREKLGVEPGSVSPFGLIYDTEKVMEVYVDSEVYNAEIVGFHPNRNTATLELTHEMFAKFLELLAQEQRVVEL